MNEEKNLKKCPFCAEDINIEAIKCKHCGTLLNESDKKKKEQPTIIVEKKKRIGCCGGIFLLTIIFIVGIAVISSLDKNSNQIHNTTNDTLTKNKKEAETEKTGKEDNIKTIDYKIIHAIDNKRFDGGKNYYLLIDPIDLKTNKFMDEVKLIVDKMVRQNGKKISIEIHDNEKSLDLSYSQYGDMSLGRPLTKSEIDLEGIHFIAAFDGDLSTGSYLNSIMFFPGTFTDNKLVGKYVSTIEYNPK